MRFPKLEVLALSAYFALPTSPQPVPVQRLQLPLSKSEKSLVEQYDDTYNLINLDKPKSGSRISILGQEIQVRWYVTDDKEGNSVYSMVAHAKADTDFRDLLFLVGTRYLEKMKRTYALDAVEVAFAEKYIKSNIADVSGVRIDVQYEAGQDRGLLRLYDEDNQKLIGQTMLSSSLAMAVLHFCYSESRGNTNFLAEDYYVTMRDQRRGFDQK